MCGIAGAKSQGNIDLKNVLQLVLNIEHRGKDATGIAYVEDGEIKVIKKAIPPSQFYNVYAKALGESSSAIAHNRAASTNIQQKHLDSEAHPFLAEDGSFALCHNGTFRGYEYMGYLLEVLGHKRSSGVDSEVFVHLLELLMQHSSNRLEAIKHLYKLSQGNILVLFDDGELYALAGSACEILKADGKYYIASEAKAFSNLLTNIDKAKVLTPSRSNGIAILNSSAKLIGDWDEVIIKDGDFIAQRYVSCDFCGSYKYCEAVKIDNKQYDRCYDCYKANKTTPIRRSAYPSYVYPYDYDFRGYVNRSLCDYSPKQPEVKTYVASKGKSIKCSICGKAKLVFTCTVCGRHFCLDHIGDDDCMC